MTINLNVLGVFIENEIGGNLNSTSVISMKRGTSSLRKPKLLKKTAFIIFSCIGKLSEYCSLPSSMEQIIRRYQRVTGTHISKQDNRDQRHNELARMRNEKHNLQLNLQRNTDDDLSFIQFKEFDELEQQLEHSIKKVGARNI
ncbi:hypothetical protein VitviT2T_000146 [Vitis vinifera]|uniref:K-box domain-containing protein n=1 Tax=Vitis vinifera TaxID=29760 RepID=A0ABY9BCZ1_VITVI|nr:hypothetical protein VitviT2T_000146 [Vitis vinifera]